MPLRKAAKICAAVALLGYLQSPARAVAPDTGIPPNGGPEAKSAGREERIARSAGIARRIVEEMPWYDFWPSTEDLWHVKQITLGAELKRTPADLRTELTTVYEEAVSEATQAGSGPPAQSRWAQAGDVAFAALRYPEAERCYNEGLMRADSAGERQETLRMAERLADVMHAEQRYQDELLQLGSIAAQRTNPGLEDPAPLRTAARTALCLRALRRAPEALAGLEATCKAQPAKLTQQRADLLFAWSVRYALLSDTGQTAAGETEARHILAECERVYGKNDAHIAFAALRLACALRPAGPRSEMKKVVQRARDLSVKYYGPDHPLTILVESQTAVLEASVGHYDAAEALLRHTLEIRESYLPPDHFEIMTDLTSLAALAFKTNRLLDEQRFARAALEISEKKFGPSAKPTVDLRRELDAVTAKLAGQSENALALKETLPPQVIGRLAYSPATVSRLNRAAAALINAGQLEEAEVYLLRALELSEKAKAVETLEYGVALHHLAVYRLRKGQVVEAEELCRRALAVEEKALGPESPDLVDVLDDLAGILVEEDRPTEAERLLLRAIPLCKATGHEESVESLRTLRTMVAFLQRYHRFAEALEFQRKVVAATEISGGNKDRSYGQALSVLAMILVDLKRPDEAEHALDQAIAIGEKLPQDDVSLPDWLCVKAVLHARRNETAKADLLFRRGLGILLRQSSRAGTELPELTANFKSYAVFLQKAGFDQTQVAERVNHIRHGEDVPDL